MPGAASEALNRKSPDHNHSSPQARRPGSSTRETVQARTISQSKKVHKNDGQTKLEVSYNVQGSRGQEMARWSGSRGDPTGKMVADTVKVRSGEDSAGKVPR